MIEPTQQEIMDTFPELYEGYVATPTTPVEIDDELGLEVVQKETMESKYGLGTVKDNSFTRSLREQFDRKGYLSSKQVECLR